MVKNKAYSSVDYAYETLKGWILSGFLIPGTKIDQEEAARKIGLSGMPLRHALERLNAEGLVIKTPNRGVIVPPVSYTDLNNVFDLRAQLEAMALIQTMNNITDTFVSNLNAMLNIHEFITAPSVSTIMEQNRAFHHSIVQHCGNQTLITMLENIWDQCERYRRIYFQAPSSNDRIMAEHRELVHLIGQRKTQEASDFLIKHTRQSQQWLLKSFSKDIEPLLYKPEALV